MMDSLTGVGIGTADSINTSGIITALKMVKENFPIFQIKIYLCRYYKSKDSYSYLLISRCCTYLQLVNMSSISETTVTY